ncbi:hypothetical protein PRAG_00201 [Prochlorococcus phage P-SSM3]|uniref:Uncharacterized protein n=1 Tax=Prochlorococcus phage P-SSM3 TaxID=536453 RepID=R9S8C1_9CAUD|nr:hypothetical protein PRAG_00201 [Prochlorococcus phage P-SSM3]AGN12138.1 hypothetical protein PRAG_00201 [Prochlorococcus phage P-SSM3]
MSTTWTLIPWNELTTSIDTLQAIDNNKETMTYLDLYQQLSELNSDELTQTVSIYDKHVDDYSIADNELINNNGKVYIGI